MNTTVKFKSKALEVNIADYHVDVAVDPKYFPLQEIMSQYFGVMERLNTFLSELSHPYKNWNFIVQEARCFSLDYFHLLKTHARGPEGAALLLDIFFNVLEESSDAEIQSDAADNLLLFLNKIVKDADADLPRFLGMVDLALLRIHDYPDPIFSLIARSYYSIKRLAESLVETDTNVPVDFSGMHTLLLRYFRYTYAYWLSEKDPRRWFEKELGQAMQQGEVDEIFREISWENINRLLEAVEKRLQSRSENPREIISRLLENPGHHEIVDAYRQIPKKIFSVAPDVKTGHQRQLIFLFHIMNIEGLSTIHEETLREINRTLIWLINHQERKDLRRLIQKTFSILKTETLRHPTTALNCVLNTGKGVYSTDEIELINFFIDSVIDLGFQTPMIDGVGNDWQIRMNSAHLQNIRTWLEIIEINPKLSIRMLSSLIIYLSIFGVFIKDTDLFPRDVTRLLNSDIGPVYNLVKQLARLFPVFFNDIGAEGKLRDISTEIDEICHRKDPLVHFLRKQSHVESSNRIIAFMEAVLKYWETGSKAVLQPYVPPNIYDLIQSQGFYIDGVSKVINYLIAQGVSLPGELVHLKVDRLKGLLENVSELDQTDVRRVELAAAMYKLLYQKYHFDFVEMNHYIAQLRAEAFPDLDRLKEALLETDPRKRLTQLVEYLDQLKSLILSEKTYAVREDIYKKRHVAADIPSMYGSYHELKFDAMGLTFRIESLVNVLFEELVDQIDLSLITKATFFQIYDLLQLFNSALKLDGTPSVEFDGQMELLAHALQVRGFSLTQYLDIFKGITRAVKNIINDYFNNIHGRNLNRILSIMPPEQILPKYLPQHDTMDSERLKHRVSEVFFRDRISLSLGLPQLDLFLSRILSTLFRQADKLPKEKLHLLLNYDPKHAMTCIGNVDKKINGVIYLGNKGYNLTKLHGFGLSIPPGFIITTEVFRCREIIASYPPAEQNFREQVQRHIGALEKITGKIFGDPRNPLLLSVRSGSSISQPGMLDTFLDVGINEQIARGIAARTGNAWFAWDNYRRFLQCYGMILGLTRNDFDAIIAHHKQKAGIPYKRGFTGEQMKNLALEYKQRILDEGIQVLDNPYDQLYLTINKVLGSWESPRAKTYRSIMGISDDWGTAVTVQSMVFGNLSRQSGTGVFFTHNPRWAGDTLNLWGDFTIGNQGEDVVAGLVKTLPVSNNQRELEVRKTGISLETHFPDVYKTMKQWAKHLIFERGWSPQEIEFTFEGSSAGQIYLLQSRDMAIRESEKVALFDPDGLRPEKFLAHGIGVSGGAMTGRLVFSIEEIEKWRALEPERHLILARNDTAPDDIREIFAADGLLTARGGLTSHASVVAHQLGKTCVVGCADLVCDEGEKRCMFRNAALLSGDEISIDGQEGSVYLGYMKIRKT